jgi:hypothetical protein
MSTDRLDMNDVVASQLAARGIRLDTTTTAAFSRQLEYLQAEALKAEYPEYKGLALVPVFGNAIPLGARSHTYRQVEGFGEAELLDNMTPEEFPTADVRGTETSSLFRTLGAKYHVTIEDLRAASMMSVNVESEKAALARLVIESKLDKLVWSGGGPFNGITHSSMSQNDTVAAGSPDLTVSDSQTVSDLKAMFKGMRDAAFTDTKGLFPDYDFVVPTKVKLALGLWIPSTEAGAGTTLEDFILKNVPGIRSISHCNRLDLAGTGGTKDLVLAFPRDPKVLDVMVPIRFEQFAPQLSGMQFTTFCSAKYGGIRIKHTKAVRRCDVTV